MAAVKPQSSAYVLAQARAYSLYIMINRAIPSAADGMKSGGRRTLWTARDGKKWKTASLAGATMPIHPHAAPEEAINTLTAQYGNNIPLFHGDMAFGTLLEPKEYSAPRYTAVTASMFTQDVLYRDLDIVPMVENYDGTLEEPAHFLPLVPMALLNPAEGIVVGFSTYILPRALDDIIVSQLAHLRGAKSLSTPMPKCIPLNSFAHRAEETERGVAYYFDGEYTQKDTSTITITKLPYGQPHNAVTAKINDLIEKGVILECDDESKDTINIHIKFSRGYLKTVERADVLKMLGLSVRHIEHLNVINFENTAVWSTDPVEFIRKFTDWRLGWYVKRYERLRDLLKIELQRYYDIRIAIKHNVGSYAKKVQSRAELRELVGEFGIVNTDYIADLPIYRFTEEENNRNEERIAQSEAKLKEYEHLIESDDARKQVYVSELQEVLTKYNKGQYNE